MLHALRDEIRMKSNCRFPFHNIVYIMRGSFCWCKMYIGERVGWWKRITQTGIIEYTAHIYKAVSTLFDISGFQNIFKTITTCKSEKFSSLVSHSSLRCVHLYNSYVALQRASEAKQKKNLLYGNMFTMSCGIELVSWKTSFSSLRSNAVVLLLHAYCIIFIKPRKYYAPRPSILLYCTIRKYYVYMFYVRYVVLTFGSTPAVSRHVCFN